jgi:hypothetical protein
MKQHQRYDLLCATLLCQDIRIFISYDFSSEPNLLYPETYVPIFLSALKLASFNISDNTMEMIGFKVFLSILKNGDNIMSMKIHVLHSTHKGMAENNQQRFKDYSLSS